jgi:transposase
METGQRELIAPSEVDRIQINARCFLRSTDGCIVVCVHGQPVLSYDADDTAACRLAMVQLAEAGIANQKQIARGFGVQRVTVYRQIEKYRAGGVSALVPSKRGPKGPRTTGGRKDQVIINRKRAGESNYQIAERLGTSEASIRLALKRLGYVAGQATQCSLPGVALAPGEEPTTNGASVETDEVATPSSTSGQVARVQGSLAEAPIDDSCSGSDHEVVVVSVPAEVEDEETQDTVQGTLHTVAEVSTAPKVDTATRGREATSTVVAAQDVEVPTTRTVDAEPSNRAGDRLFARMGLLFDAAPLFGNAQGVPEAGALLAMPVLVSHGVFADALEVFQPIGPAFYGLRNVVLTLVTCFMLGINRPENLKRTSPSSLGRVLGLDRAPEMKTLRRKIQKLANQKSSLGFARLQMKRHLNRIPGDLLWIYIDGHVSVYSGKRKLKKHHVTRLRLSMPSVLDYWVNDANGDPLFVFTGRARTGMVAVLRELIEEMRNAGENRKLTLVFDREGWSPALFASMSQMEGIRFVSYRKAARGRRLPRLPVGSFNKHEMVLDGQRSEYKLADKNVHILYGSRNKRKRLTLRQVTRLTETGKQTHVVTNDWESSAPELAHRMFSRWGQENFFKYMGHNRDFDALTTYLMEDADPNRMVANPARSKQRKELERQRAELAKLTAAYGSQALDNEEVIRPTMRGFKIANGALGQKIRGLREQVEATEARIAKIPAKVPLSEVAQGKPAKAHQETRRLMHVFRMAAHRAESGLRELFRPVFPRWRHESREMVRSFLSTPGDLEVARDELRVTLQAQASPHRTRVLEYLCKELNTLNTKFPGSNLVLRFGVRGASDVTGSEGG